MIVPVETPRGPCTDAAATYAAAGVFLCSTRMVLSACPTRSNVAPSASIAYRVTCSSWPDTPPVLRETQPRSRAADIAPQPAVAAPITINLELTRIGHRNISLFNVVRTWAYVQPKPCTIEAWAATVLKYGREQNRRFRDPLLPDEVGILSWNVASWTWNGGGAIDHGIMAQSRRGLVSAAVRRYRTYDRGPLHRGAARRGRPSSRGSSGVRRVTSHGVPNTRQTRKATPRT